MKTDFKEYLQKNKAQKAIDKIAKQYKDKKIVLYCAGYFASDLLKNYDLSELNIIGVADIKFQYDTDGDFYGYKKINAYDLLENEFDLLLITAYDDEPVKDFLKEELLEGEKPKFKIKTLIKMSLWHYIVQVIKDEL